MLILRNLYLKVNFGLLHLPQKLAVYIKGFRVQLHVLPSAVLIHLAAALTLR